MNEILTIPVNEQALIEYYLNKTKHIELIKRHRLVQRAITNSLSIQERRKNNLSDVDTKELHTEFQQLKQQLFQAAMIGFAEQVCQNQIEICDEQFWEAPCGKESEYILKAPFPDLCPDPERYQQMKKWWEEQGPEQKQEIADNFASCQERQEREDEAIKTLYDCWYYNLPFETRKRIFLHYNSVTII